MTSETPPTLFRAVRKIKGFKNVFRLSDSNDLKASALTLSIA